MASRDDNTILEFLALAAADRAGGRLRPVEDYRRLFPGHDAVIEAEYAAFLDGGSAASDTTAAGGSEVRTAVLPPAIASLRLGPYRLVRELGRGGQGVVYEALDPRLGRKVALKVLSRPGLVLAPLVVAERFRREAEIAARLDHPSICSVYEVGEADGHAFIAMRYVDGETLAARIAAKRLTTRPPGEDWEEAARILKDAALAVEAAHVAGILHRDIKPGNVMIDRDGRPVILDFGLSRDDESGAETLTRSDDVLGTPAYMAPEQLDRKASEWDARVDVYALGVSLYEAVALRRPFEGATREQLYVAIREKEATALDAIAAGVPRDLAVIAATAMAKEPDRRYRSAAAFAEDLRRLLAREPILAKPPTYLERVGLWARREPGIAALAAALVLLFGVAALSLGLKNRELEEKRQAAELLRTKAETGERIANEALDEVRRLADGQILAELVEGAERLLPARPENALALANWCKRAGDLVGRLVRHQADLAALRRVARERGQAEIAAEFSMEEERRRRIAADIDDILAQIAANRDERQDSLLRNKLQVYQKGLDDVKTVIAAPKRWWFDDPDRQWRHDVLATLVAEIEKLAQPETGLLATMRKEAETARTAVATTIDAHRSEWEAAAALVRGDPRFRGLELLPQVGLIPLGVDPASKLPEFLVAATHINELPKRGADGRLDVVESTGLVIVLLPGARYLMGAQHRDPEDDRYDPESREHEEEPLHEVELEPFFISKFEVSQAQWRRITGRNPALFHPDYNIGVQRTTLFHAVENVAWDECVEWARRLDLLLPTEAQWEYAYRGGTETRFWTGDDPESIRLAENLADQAAKSSRAPWVPEDRWGTNDDGYIVHAPVTTGKPNRFGLHNMAGNVKEWVRDNRTWYRDPTRRGDGERLVLRSENQIIRGGSYQDAPDRARAAFRDGAARNYRASNVGLRPTRRLERK